MSEFSDQGQAAGSAGALIRRARETVEGPSCTLVAMIRPEFPGCRRELDVAAFEHEGYLAAQRLMPERVDCHRPDVAGETALQLADDMLVEGKEGHIAFQQSGGFDDCGRLAAPGHCVDGQVVAGVGNSVENLALVG